MNFKRIKQSPFVIVLLVIITYLCLVIDTFKYPGAVGSHFFVDAKVYFALSVVILLFTTTKTKSLGFLLKVNKIFIPVISVFCVILVLLEGLHYRNYILNLLGIHIEGLITLVLFTISLYLADRFKFKTLKLGKWAKAIYVIIVFLLVFYFAKNIALTTNMALNRNAYILFHLRNTYDERIFYEWGKQYQFMKFVKDNTPPGATIVIPPEQDPWLMGSGNGTFVRAFLFPRKIMQEDILISPKTFVLIDWGKEECKPDPECHGWPRQNIKATKIIYKNPDSVDIIEVQENKIYFAEI